MKPLIQALFFISVAAWVLYFTLEQANRPPSISGDEYVKLQLKGVITAKHGHDRGKPIVTINQHRVTLAVPGVFSNYIRVGDSIVKYPNRKLVRTYRFTQDSVVSILWGSKYEGFMADENGIISATKQRRQAGTMP